MLGIEFNQYLSTPFISLKLPVVLIIKLSEKFIFEIIKIVLDYKHYQEQVLCQ